MSMGFVMVLMSHWFAAPGLYGNPDLEERRDYYCIC